MVLLCCRILCGVICLRIYLFEGEFGWRLSEKNNLGMEFGMEVVGRLWDRSGNGVGDRWKVGEGQANIMHL